MRKLFILIAILFSLNAFATENATGYALDGEADKMLTVLGLSDVRLMIAFLPNQYSTRKMIILGKTTMARRGIYTIFIKRGISLKEAVKVLAHEMIHVWQYDESRLVRVTDREFLWNGWISIEIDPKKYHHLPWEVEARELAEMLLDRIR